MISVGSKINARSSIKRFAYQVSTRCAEQTHGLAQKIGEAIESPAILALTGDLGSGKTVFIQGLAKGLGVPEDYYVTSPSYTLINEYPARIPFFHVDLYRINSIEEAEDIGLWEILHGNHIVAIEWADRLEHDLPSDNLAIHLEITSEKSRKIDFTASGQRHINLLKKIEFI
ncbi:MAG: tRNA (adenosine(37)-N6)-threonylcarbamoyltransferase complex ATPase subunit type 1 TsaE [Deltaproteobacteria bacterium]|nr:tRNA (adenosine(37)-N6)-threonylcarbamoyltransferase complex ATPase subunit type 1 TsaE [Deltaproteobacteria bacterium]MBW1962585.1 tRNA (adenosine(37)-N6)-threonylcarbamoyltransferase complex ATPase subunit type 1 TsaE [Deltaproteobacteria bacterium]MBW2154643.1 tRNA (adenosine(37)-N6)-threonylcarbamoyltransferase complex ATPase subunit type 1 TsaE [Deltaproteobacteria bacterium]